MHDRSQGPRTKVIGGYDDLTHGPLTPDGDVSMFWQARQTFWTSFGLNDVEHAYSFDLHEEFLDTVKAIRQSAEVEFWCSPKVSEQFHLTVMLHLLNLAGVGYENIKIRQFTDPKAQCGLGVLNTDELAIVSDAVAPVDINIDLYRRAWLALSDGTVGGMTRFVDTIDASEPIAIALRAYLLRFPECNGGLGSLDRALLGAGREETRTVMRTVGSAMMFNHPSIDTIGDWALAQRLIELSKAPVAPWFEIEGDVRDLRNSKARLTESGKQARDRYYVQVL